MNSSTGLCLGLLCAFSVAGFTDVSQAAAEPDTILIRPARILDVQTGKYRNDVDVSITGGRIISIDKTSGATSAQVIELPGLTLLPGLMDVHTHLTYDVEDDYTNQAVKENLADLALRGVRNAKRTLMAGFTTVRDVGAWDFSDVALARAVDKGWIDGPRIIPSGNMIGITGGHCDITGFIPGVKERGPKTGSLMASTRLSKRFVTRSNTEQGSSRPVLRRERDPSPFKRGPYSTPRQNWRRWLKKHPVTTSK